MFKRLLKVSFVIMIVLPLTVLGNGLSKSNSSKFAKPQNCTKKIDNKTCDGYPVFTPAYSCKTYKASGLYLGIQGSYVYVIDYAKFEGTSISNPFYLPIDLTNHRNSYGGGAYIGYGHIFDYGFLPYLGAELGFNLRSNYNQNGGSLDDGNLYGKKINSRGSLSFDIMPGFFYDDTNTTLLYLRLGIEGDQFELKSSTNDIGDDYSYQPLVRAGVGIEHEIIDNFYIRADYVFSALLDDVSYSPYLPIYDDSYSSRVYFNTFSIGITYRF